ncbi:hypothetical protein SNE40_013539 [Patella caerulea]|uniref:Uncharacterized protein n=1 Tax=Patella caerulea TaxID=87958 RepID=A0AAN8JG48_PATCE
MLNTRKSVNVLEESNVNAPNQYVDWDTRLSTDKRLNEDAAMDSGCEEGVEMDSDYQTLIATECDVLESRIFIRKIVKNSTTKLGKKKRSERVYNTTSIIRPFC